MISSQKCLCVVALLGVSLFGPVSAYGQTGDESSAVPLFKTHNASETPRLFHAEVGGVPDRYIVLLEPGSRPAHADADDLTRQFGGQIRRAWDAALRGFLVEMNVHQAEGMSHSPFVKGIYQDIALPAEDILANDAPYCYPAFRDECDPPGNWIFNQRTFQGLPQTITCTDPDPAGTGCIDNWGLDRLDGPSTSRDGVFDPLNSPQGTGVHVYVLDTGIKANNLDFGGRVSGGHNGTYDEHSGCAGCFPFCFPPCGTDTNDYHGHGSHVTGILGGQFFGVAKDVSLHPVRFYNNRCLYVESALIDGLNWIKVNHIAALGTGIVNLSSASSDWATGANRQPIRDAVMGLVSRDDLLLIQAAGNVDEDACAWGFGDESLYTPGTPEHDAALRVMIVGGSDEDDGRWICESGDENCFSGNLGSNYGACLDLFGPAAHIVSAYHGDGGIDDDKAACRLSGTSMASPHVAGTAALILESEPFLTSSDLKARILAETISGSLEANAADPNYIGSGSPNLLVHTEGTSIFADGFESGDTSRWN